MSNANKRHGISWHKVSSDNIENYKEAIDISLDSVNIDYCSISCDDVHCSNDMHRDAINNMCSNIIDICLKAGDQCFPKVSAPKRRIPKWNSTRGRAFGALHREN